MGKFVQFMYLALLPIVLANNYCSVCSNHTMCRFTSKNPACGKNSEGGVSPAEAKEIVDLHNEYRGKIAKGQETRGKPGPQPPAGNMQALVWDEKLAEVAQRWADQCTFQHDQCRNDPRFEVGQNIYLISGSGKVNWTRAINSWFNEINDFSAKDIKSFKPNPKTGHFTQIAWANTSHIGCGRVTFNGAYRPFENRPQEFILSSIPSRDNEAKSRFSRHMKPGFFGGAIYDSSGAKGAFTATSGRVPVSTGSFKGYWPSRGNFLNNDISAGNTFDNLGFFGGAIFNPIGAQGAFIASSRRVPGITGSLSGNQPSTHFGGNYFNNGFAGITGNNPGFFGGTRFNPEGARGAITATSSGMYGNTGSLSGNRPSMHFGGNFFNNGFAGFTENNPGFFGGTRFNPEGARGAITATSSGMYGNTGSLSGNRPWTHSGGNYFNNGFAGFTENNPGFFGGTRFNPAGARGAITATSSGMFGNTGSLSGNEPSSNFGGNFINNGFNSNNRRGNPGFFGGASFKPEGAQGAITATSAGHSGSSGSSSGNNRPSSPIGSNFPNNGIGDIDKNNNPGFFGGATFKPEGAQGAITATSTGISGGPGPSNINQPSTPTAGGHFPSNVNGGSSSNYPETNGNYPNYPNFQSGGNGPHYPSFPGNYPGSWDLKSGSYLQSYGQRLVNMPAASGQVDSEVSSQQKSNNVRIPSDHDIEEKDHILICNYGPAGNLQGESLYTEGKECSHCPTGTTCSNGLCIAS